MADLQHLTDGMLQAAATVLGRLVEQPVSAGTTSAIDTDGSIRIDSEMLVTTADIPALGVRLVARFRHDDIVRVVSLMLGGMDDSEMGAMQLSIVSETVSQVAASMAEELARQVGAAAEGVHADLCTDATNLPPPPFISYAGHVAVGDDFAAEVIMDFDGIAASKLGAPSAPQHEPEPERELVAAAVKAPAAERPQRSAAPAPKAQPVSFAAMAPTPRAAHSGGNNLDLVHDVPLQISAVLGRTALTLRDVVTLQSGSVFELDKLSTDPIDLYVNNILIARGEVVVVDDKFAVKISELNPSVE